MGMYATNMARQYLNIMRNVHYGEEGITGTPFKNVNRLWFTFGNYEDDNNDGPPDAGNRPATGDSDGNNGDNGSPPSNDNINALTTVLPRVGILTNPIQANIRSRAAGKIICGNMADNDDISSVSSTSSMSEEDAQPVIHATHTTNQELCQRTSTGLQIDHPNVGEDDNSWDTVMAERNAQLGRYHEELFPPYPVNNTYVNREEWLSDIRHCL
jgi:hypothetical protein